MPLPLPNLDTRRWADLIEEGRALIPRHAPGWTDHNVHDPGITLIELFAWLIEQDIYRVNRVPDRHRRKFLALTGFAPWPPHPARTILSFTLNGTTELMLSAGTTFATGSGATPVLRFRTLSPLTVIAAQLRIVQVFDGLVFADQTRVWREGSSFPLLGPNPQVTDAADAERQPAVYLGFDQALPQGKTVSLWLQFEGPRTGEPERERIREEVRREAEACQPPRPRKTCPPPEPSADPWCPPEDGGVSVSGDETAAADTLPPHHAVRTAWEYYNGSAWRLLDADQEEVVDDTRGFTLDGAVHITLPGAMGQHALGASAAALFYLRCRLVAGPPDAAPVLRNITVNTVPVEQASPARSTFKIAPDVTPPLGQEPQRGKRGKLQFALNPDGVITALAMGQDLEAPEVLVLDYQPAAETSGTLTVTLLLAGWGTGLPGQRVVLPDAPIAHGRADIWTIEDSTMRCWRPRPDLDASRRTDADFTLDATTGEVSLGDGERGRVVPMGAPILAIYDITAGAAGNVGSGADWRLSGADDALNRALLNSDPAAIAATAATLKTIANPASATGGADAEDLDHAAGRAVEALWAHERLVELCPQADCATLDQLDPLQVLARAAPARATTLLDFERLALNVPGTRVVRARAWASLDPAYPCLRALGTVTVVLMPELPQCQPRPSPGLLRAVHRYLDRRRIIGTRLVVVGPQYLEVHVRARVRAKAGARPERVRDDIIKALNTFLDPLQGGPNGRGWPFGRDVYRAEILQVIDGVSGVDHVLTLELIPGEGETQCGNLCVCPTWLVAPGQHTVEVV